MTEHQKAALVCCALLTLCGGLMTIVAWDTFRKARWLERTLVRDWPPADRAAAMAEGPEAYIERQLFGVRINAIGAAICLLLIIGAIGYFVSEMF